MARFSIGSNVKKGPRRGEVLKHRPQGMVDVKFTDVDWVERHQAESLQRDNPRSNPVGVTVNKDSVTGYWSVYGYDDSGCAKNITGDVFTAKKVAQKEATAIRRKIKAGTAVDTIAKGYRSRYRQHCGPYRNPAGKEDYYDPADEQFRRVQMAIYESQKERGLSDDEAWKSSWAIATRQGQKYGWLKPGTQEPTAKGRRGSKQKLKTGDAWAKRQKYELELGRRRKSGKHRVVPQKHGKQTRYYVQPGGRYFLKKEKALAERDRLNGVLMDMVGEGLADALVANPLPAIIGTTAAVASLADLGYRAVKSKKKKKKKGQATENPRFLDERGGMSRGHFGVHSAAVNALAEARILGRLKGLQAIKLAQVPSSRKQKFGDQRRELQNAVEQTDLRFKGLLNSVISQIPGGEYGRRTQAQKKAMGALRGAYSDAYSETLLERERERAARKSRRTANPPKDLPPDWATSATGRPAFGAKRTKGISIAGVENYWASVKTSRPGEYVPPKMFQGFDEDGEKIYYLVFEGRNRRRLDFIRRKIQESNRVEGLRGRRWKKDKRVTNLIFKEKPGSAAMLERYRIRHPKSGKGSARDPYRIYDMKTKRIVFTATRKTEADEKLRKLQGKVPREFVGRAGEPIEAYYTDSQGRASWVVEALEDRGIIVDRSQGVRLLRETVKPRRKAKRSGRERKLQKIAEIEAELAKLRGNPRRRRNTTGMITRKSDLRPDERYTIWLKMPSGGYVIERSYLGRYIRDAMWSDIQAYNKNNTRKYVVVDHGVDPNTGYRKNDMAKSSVIRRMKAAGYSDHRFEYGGGEIISASFRSEGLLVSSVVQFRHDVLAGGWSISQWILHGSNYPKAQGKVISSDLLKCGMPSLGNAVLWFTKQSTRENPPARKNFVGAAVRGVALAARSPLGKKIAVEAAVVAGLMVGDKLVQKGKMSPKAMSYIQRRVEQQTGVKPSKSQVTAVLKDLDANKDQDLTDAEITEAVKLLRKKK